MIKYKKSTGEVYTLGAFYRGSDILPYTGSYNIIENGKILVANKRATQDFTVNVDKVMYWNDDTP